MDKKILDALISYIDKSVKYMPANNKYALHNPVKDSDYVFIDREGDNPLHLVLLIEYIIHEIIGINIKTNEGILWYVVKHLIDRYMDNDI